MQVLLLKDVAGVGRKGELKQISDGYAQNFLIPKKLAAVATKEIIDRLAKEKREATEKDKKLAEQAKTTKLDLEKRIFTVGVKVGGNGKIFGAVKEKDVAEVIRAKTGVAYDKSAIHIDAPIKSLGEHTVSLKLVGGLTAQIKINVTSN